MKVLEFMNKNDLAPVGGATGYVYILYLEDQLNGALNFLDLPKSNCKNNRCKNEDTKQRLKKDLSLIRNIIVGKRSKMIENGEFSVIHFHSTEELYKYRRSLRRYAGKVVLTSHSPTLLSKEYYDASKKWEKLIFGLLFLVLPIMDKSAFRLADYIFFPCVQSEEPYQNAWKGFKKFKEKNRFKFRYLLSGIYECHAKIAKEEIRKKYSIPQDAFLITYVGRHNKIKGYKLLQEVGRQYYNSKDVFFLIAGKEEPIKGLNQNNWIEVGWTDDPHSIINAGDLFILPNEETYFDLVLLEVLSLGKIALIHDTGGNKFFDKQYKGIFHFDNINDCISKIEAIRRIDNATIKQLEIDNGNKYKNFFSSKVFYLNYINLISNLS